MLSIIRNHIARTQYHYGNRALLSGINQTAAATIPIHGMFTRNEGSNSAAYDGDGKTTVTVLNSDESHLNLVNTYSANGFRGKDITMESLLIFDLIVPKTKIVIIGYGQYGEPYDSSIPIKLKKKGISCEMLATPNAVTTYNYLVHDSVHVAGAFLPVKDPVYMETRDYAALKQHDIMYGDGSHAQLRSREEVEPELRAKQLFDAYVNKDPDKKTFD